MSPRSLPSSVARATGLALVTVALFSAAPAWPQTTRTAPDAKVQRWTQKEWSDLTQEYRRDREKWNACTKRASAQRPKGHDIWTYIHGCMKD